MIVMKFGGTSMESSEALLRAAEIVKGRAKRQPVVVVSAMGKTTNRLIALAEAAVKRRDYRCDLEGLREYHWEEASAAIEAGFQDDLHTLLDAHFNEISQLLGGLAVIGEITPRSMDAITSYGERVSSRVFTLVLRSQGLAASHVDAREVIITDDKHTAASPLFDKIDKAAAKKLGPLLNATSSRDKPCVVVMGGFIASAPDGRTTTLGRGGSDYTASIVGAALNADEIEIWTDVDGMLTSDPRILKDVHRIRKISFAEAAELAYFGAKVLHPSTVVPALEKDIPVRILNSRSPDIEGTLIVSKVGQTRSVVKSIACKRNITLLNVHSSRMLMAHGFLKRVFEVFERYATSVDVVSTSEVSVSLTIDDASSLAPVLRELGEFSDVSVESDQALICVVGEGIRSTPGVASRVFRALEKINVRMISQGASKLNISLVVSDSELEKAIRKLHAEFFSEPLGGEFA